MRKRKRVKMRINEMVENRNMTTGEIYEAIHNATTKKEGRRVKKDVLTKNELQMVLRYTCNKVGFCNQTKQTIWGKKYGEAKN